MKHLALSTAALLITLGLGACDRPTVVNVPAAPVAPPAVSVVAGPAGPPGVPGEPGEAGKAGKPGDNTVIVVPVPASDPAASVYSITPPRSAP